MPRALFLLDISTLSRSRKTCLVASDIDRHRATAHPAAYYIVNHEYEVSYKCDDILLHTRYAKFMAEPGALKKPRITSNGPKQAAELLKAKQGLIGFANGFNIAAMADTGS